MPRPPTLTRFAWLCIAAALVTMAMKAVAYLLTGSVGLLSDAVESGVNLVAAVVALVALRVAEKPPDADHEHGHAKAEYFSAGIEGAMILVAASAILWVSVERLLDPVELEMVGVGLAVSTAAAGVNLVVALVLGRAGRRHRSITLEAGGRHLLTDVWTSGGVLVGVALVAITGWERLDPLVALAVGVNIAVAGLVLLRRSVRGLMDVALPADQRAAIDEVLARHVGSEVQFHAVRTRQAGRRSFMSVHLLVPGAWSVQQAHDLADGIEMELCAAVPDLSVVTHVEPLEDPRSFADDGLDRREVPPSARPGEPGPTGRGGAELEGP